MTILSINDFLDSLSDHGLVVTDTELLEERLSELYGVSSIECTIEVGDTPSLDNINLDIPTPPRPPRKRKSLINKFSDMFNRKQKGERVPRIYY